MRVDANRQKLDGLQSSPEKAIVSASDASRGARGASVTEGSRPELQLRVEALLKVLPEEPLVRSERIREVAARLAEGGYVTELAAYKTAASILGTERTTGSEA
jgi:hypothetical protein